MGSRSNCPGADWPQQLVERIMGRNQILEGAADILDQGVYGDLTVDALARALRMSRSTLYKHFAGKDDVVVALVDGICGETETALAALPSRTLLPMEGVIQIFEVLASHADRLPRALVLQVARLPEACQDRLSLTRSAVLQSLQRVIERGHTDGEVTYTASMLAAQALLASVDAAMRASAREEIALKRSQAVQALLGLFLPGLSRIGRAGATGQVVHFAAAARQSKAAPRAPSAYRMVLSPNR